MRCDPILGFPFAPPQATLLPRASRANTHCQLHTAHYLVVFSNSMTQQVAATSESTRRYAERFRATAATGHFREQQGLTLSSIGIGTYLGNADEQTDNRYLETVALAAKLGSNVI